MGRLGYGACSVEQTGTRVALHAPAFTFWMDISAGLRAGSWENYLSGTILQLGDGPEVELDFDQAERRIGITGWRSIMSEQGSPAPDEERGYREGFFRPYFDDSAWKGILSPAHVWHYTSGDPGPRYYWTRTRVFVPLDCVTQPLSLVLGGFGLFDFRTMRVFLNGYPIGTRTAPKRWNEPGAFDLGPSSESHCLVRFGQDNVITLQLSGHVTRTKRLDEIDPLHGRSFYLGAWPAQFEQYLVVGALLHTPNLHVADVSVEREGASGEVVVTLRTGDESVAAKVCYQWDVVSPVLLKTVEVTNISAQPRRLMHVRLGQYQTNAEVTDGEQGFPVYLDDDRFATLAHPSGWAIGEDGNVTLKHYPGKMLAPGESIRSMEAVLGVAEKGKAREAFLAHVRSRMRRVVRGHDRPNAIFEGFGSWAYDPAQATGTYAEVVDAASSDIKLLDNLRALVLGEVEAGCHFDIYSIEFWVDYYGDLTRFDPTRFPDGPKHVNAELAKVGTALGLWIDSSWEEWSIGGNPVVMPTFTHDRAYGSHQSTMCRATDPIKTMYSTGLRHHIRENGVRMFKFDNLQAICYNPCHDHLPGVYSTEAIQSAVIETLHDLDAECPDVILALYWGHRSPWWLLHASTLFEPGLFIEAAHPSSAPTLYVRDSVTQGLDQAQWWCADVPALGKDSLGIWLSDWKWNSSIGKERWQEGFVMDLCRGSLLAQPWSDGPWLSPPERKQMAEFIALLRERLQCFSNPRFILGNPWKNEPYGYCCTDGVRAFIALNNCTWSDDALCLALNSACGLPDGQAWDIYRWYPDPAQLKDERTHFERQVTLSLRPFEVVLLEVAPAGEHSSSGLNRAFQVQPLRTHFDEPTRQLTLDIKAADSAYALQLPRQREYNVAELPPKRVLRVTGQIPACAHGGVLAVTAELRCDGTAYALDDAGTYFAAQCLLEAQLAECTPVVRERTYPVPWQAWRITASPSARARDFAMNITALAPKEVDIVCNGYFIPT